MAGTITLTQESVSSFSGTIPTGTLTFSADTTATFSDRFSESIYVDLSTESVFEAVFIADVVGSITASVESANSFAGTSGIVGNITATILTELSLASNILYGDVSVTVDTVVSFVGGINPEAVLELNQNTLTNFSGYITNVATQLGDLTKASSVCCMNTKTAGVSTYSNYNFNSFFKIGSNYYGCSSSGLYRLSGTTDAGTEILATIKTAVSDYESQKLKAVRDCYSYIRSPGDMNVRLITNEQVDRSGYLLAYDSVDGIHRRRVKVAQGIRGTTWQVIITNESGTDFEVQQIDVIPKELTRSI